MRFGCCTNVDSIGRLESIGYDYVEMPLATISTKTEPEWESELKRIRANGIKPEAWNVMLPAEFRVTGAEVDFAKLEKHLDTAYRRAAQAGGRVVVFGCGRCRTVPEGFSRSEAEKQLREFIFLAGRTAEKYSLRLAIEPLNSRETNIINTIGEAVAYAAAVNLPSVGVLADFYHMNEEHEPLSALLDARHYLIHVHVADSNRRRPGSGNYDYQGFCKSLMEAGYDNRMSIECVWGEDEDYEQRAALEFLRKCAEER